MTKTIYLQKVTLSIDEQIEWFYLKNFPNFIPNF